EWKITGNVIIAKSKSQNPGRINEPVFDAKADVLRGMSGLSIENNYGATSGAANFFYNWGDHEINDGYSTGENPQQYLFMSTDYMAGVNIYQTYNVYDNIVLTGGFDMKLNGGNAYRGERIYADHVKLHEIAGYVLAQQKLGRSMFEVGLRVENHKLYGTEFIPQAGFSLKAADNTNLKLSVSKGFRTPNMRELYMYPTSNEELDPENSWSYDFTVSQGFLENRINTELTVFYMKGDNIITSTQITEGFSELRNTGEFTNKGVEFSLNYQILDNLAVHSNYSYLHMDNVIIGAPRHKFYAGITYNPGKFSFSTGTQAINKLYLTIGDNPQTSSYILVDARASYKALKWLDIFVKGDNLTARSYETILGYPMPRATVMGGISLNI
ncbi:MAG: TonB-dependent receptor, partial [Rikenellaceae bacterium]|nr:TonB-dependent receptor [Rikenellaceae bacterium]